MVPRNSVSGVTLMYIACAICTGTWSESRLVHHTSWSSILARLQWFNILSCLYEKHLVYAMLHSKVFSAFHVAVCIKQRKHIYTKQWVVTIGFACMRWRVSRQKNPTDQVPSRTPGFYSDYTMIQWYKYQGRKKASHRSSTHTTCVK